MVVSGTKKPKPVMHHQIHAKLLHSIKKKLPKTRTLLPSQKAEGTSQNTCHTSMTHFITILPKQTAHTCTCTGGTCSCLCLWH